MGDFLLFYACLWLALFLRGFAPPTLGDLAAHVPPFTAAFVGWAVIFYTAGLFSLDVIYDTQATLRRGAVAVLISTLGTAAMFYLLKNIPINPKTVLLIFSLLAAGTTFAWRYLFSRILVGRIAKTGVAFVGYNETVREMMGDADALAKLAFEARLVLDETGRSETEPALPGTRICRVREELAEAMQRGEAELVVISEEASIPDDTRYLLFRLLELRPRYMSLADFYELVYRRVPLGEIDETWFLENIDLRSKAAYLFAKRILDLVMGGLSFLLSAPFWPLIALGIALESPGGVFFSQMRLGRGGKPFKIYKFRTMRSDRNDFAPTAEGDPRITRFGAFLRSSRLDELPQVLNIIKGEMSFVGPRPERPELAAELERVIPYYRERLLVKPGLTGWDQVSGEYHSPSLLDTYKKLRFDLYYVKNLSVSLDFSIFFKTVLTVVLRAGR